MTKENYILSQCKGKNVLDLGCVQDIAKVDSPDWLHAKIKEIATSLIGFDIIPIRKKGFHIYKVNLEEIFKADSRFFDTVVAGDIIEHLSNPGMFLDNIKRLRFDKAIITTPNVMSPKYWTLGKEKVHKGHTCWYSMQTLSQLLSRKGFEIVDKSYGFDQKINGIRPLLRFLIYKILPQTGNKLLLTIQL